MMPNKQATTDSVTDDAGQGLRFLFVPIPATGHVSPLLPVAKKLVARGHDVRWVTSARFQQRIEATGSIFIPFRKTRDLDYDRLNEMFPERTQLSGIAQAKWDLKRMVIDMGVEQLDDILTILDEDRFDLIVSDSMALSALFAAEKLSLPNAVINAFNLFAPSKDTAPDGLALAPNATWPGRLRNRFLHWLLFRVILRAVNTHLNDARRKLGLSPLRGTLFDASFLGSDLFMQPTIPAFEYPRSDLPDHVHFIGALLPDGPAEYIKPDWWDDLNDDRPVVLVTQGTIATDFDNLLKPAVQGLADEDVLVVAATGNRPVDEIGLDSVPSNARLEAFIPFSHLMPHVDVMVTNGGYGGTHFALAHGVPLVAAGTTEDKAEICARIAWSGVGINLKTDSPTAQQIKDAVRTVLTTPQYQNKAQAMQAEFARYDAPTKAAELFEQFVAAK